MARPSAPGEKTRTSVWMKDRPCLARSSSAAIEGRKGPAAWSTVETRKPGANSSVTATPPTTGRRSRTTGRKPAFARDAAAVSPFGPAPMTTTSLFSAMSGFPAFPVFEELESRIPAVGAHDAAARVRGGSAHVEAADRRPVLGPARRGPQEEKLLQRQLALEDVSFREAPLPLEIQGSDDLAVPDDVLEVGSVLRDRVDDSVAELF